MSWGSKRKARKEREARLFAEWWEKTLAAMVPWTRGR